MHRHTPAVLRLPLSVLNVIFAVPRVLRRHAAGAALGLLTGAGRHFAAMADNGSLSPTRQGDASTRVR